jgi:hypothetical protein
MATGHVDSSFWKHFKWSPFHLKDHKVLCPGIKQLFSAFNNLDPAPNCQQAITPKFLRVLFQLSGAGSAVIQDISTLVTAQLAILAFFFAMRSCKHTSTPNPGKTKKIDIGHVIFRDK